MSKILFKEKNTDNESFAVRKIEQYLGIEYGKDNEYIFEGDVLKCFPDNIIGIVKFGEYRSPVDDLETGHYGFYIEWIKYKEILRKDIGYWMNHENIEVIGNIFDNPDIISKEQAIG